MLVLRTDGTQALISRYTFLELVTGDVNIYRPSHTHTHNNTYSYTHIHTHVHTYTPRSTALENLAPCSTVYGFMRLARFVLQAGP